MRRIPLRGEFDAAINLWTSFGYFEKPSDDLKTLRGIARALKPGARPIAQAALVSPAEGSSS